MNDQMPASRDDARLTASAKETLDEEVAIFRDRLLRQLASDKPLGAITGTDVLQAADLYAPSRIEAARLLNNLQFLESRGSELEARDRRTRVLSVVMTGVAVLGTGAAAVLTTTGTSAWQVITGFVLMIASLLGAVVSVVTNLAAERDARLRSEAQRVFREFSMDVAEIVEGTNDTSVFGREMEFVRGWNEVERQINELAELVIIARPGERIPLSKSLSQLRYMGVLTHYESGLVHDLLRVRNDLVHGGVPKHYDFADQIARIHEVLGIIEQAKERAKLIDNEMPDEGPSMRDLV